MPETPDFEQIALLLERDGWQDGQEGARAQVVAALRQVWNARGAADLAAVEIALTVWRRNVGSGLMNQLDGAVRKLDR